MTAVERVGVGGLQLYLLLNEEKEVWACKINPHRDFYNVRKVRRNPTTTIEAALITAQRPCRAPDA